MANATIRATALYVDSTKLGSMTGSTITITSNDQRQLTLDGYLGHSDGIITTDIECKGIIPYADLTAEQIVNLLLTKSYCEVQGTVGSRLVSIAARVVSIDVTSEVENGRLEGTFKFEGGEPTFV